MAEARSQIASTSGTNEKAVLPAEQTANFKRSGSFKAFIYVKLSSLFFLMEKLKIEDYRRLILFNNN